jgi:hypothetical protein
MVLNILEPTIGIAFFNNDFKSDPTKLFPSIVSLPPISVPLISVIFL